MLVHQILANKPSHEIATIAPGASVSDAVSELAARRIGALVVSEDGETVAGMFSERDIVRELGKRGVGCMSDRVKDMMTHKVITCTKGETADQVLQRMTNERKRHLPVIEDGKMVGLVSIGDVVLAKISEVEMENEALEGMIKGF